MVSRLYGKSEGYQFNRCSKKETERDKDKDNRVMKGDHNSVIVVKEVVVCGSYTMMIGNVVVVAVAVVIETQ